MFGATALAPILMGFDPNVSILFSGIATLLFFVIVGGRVPSYLGSSFAFIGPVLVATAAAAGAPNPNIGVALGGIIAAGAVYTVIGIIVAVAGYAWVERLMPPAVTGAIVAAIGLVLAPIAINGASSIAPDNPAGSAFARWIAILTIVAVGIVAVYAPGIWRRLPILIGGAVAYLAYLVFANGFGLAKPIDFSGETLDLGHIKAIGAMTGRNLDAYLGRAFIGDGLATMISGAGGGTGMTTYAENMGVMAVTRIYSTLIFVVAAFIALFLGLSPKSAR